MIEASSDLVRSSSAIFGKCRVGNVRKRSSGFWNNFGKSSAIFGKQSNIKTPIFFGHFSLNRNDIQTAVKNTTKQRRCKKLLSMT